MTDIARDLRDRLDSLRAAAARTTPATLLVRGAAFGFAACALLIAVPFEVLGTPGAVALLVGFAAIPALAPRTRLTTLVLFIAVLGWIAGTTAYDEPVSLPRLVAFACLLYLVHTTAALAAVLPYDTVVAPAVLVGWLARTAVVLAATAIFAVVAAFGARAVSGQAYLVASVAGLLLVAALVALLALLRGK